MSEQTQLQKDFSDIEKVDLKVGLCGGPAKQIADLKDFKPTPILKGYAWRGHHQTDTRIFIGYDELMMFVKDETENHNAIEFHFWIST